MGFFTDPKTGERMDADKFLKREKKEWGDALGSVAKELFGAGKGGGEKMLITSDKEVRKLLGSFHNFK